MSKGWITFFVVVGVIVAFSIFGYPYALKIYDDWGRRMIYPSGSKQTEYPGNGRATQYFYSRIYVEPRFVGEPFDDPPENRNLYSPLDYEITDIPDQEQLFYAVGQFQGWEDIPNSLDKYLIVKYPNNNTSEKWRVSFEKSELFGDNTTSLAVENININPFSNKLNEVEKPDEPSTINITHQILNGLINKNDVLILVPLFDPPALQKVDSNGIYLASWIILRRVGGTKNLELTVEERLISK